MKKTQIISEDKNHKAIDIGSFEDLSGFEFHHPKFSTVDPGRLFIGEILETTGSEISFRELPAKTKIGFLHKHKKHEEVYIFLKGGRPVPGRRRGFQGSGRFHCKGFTGGQPDTEQRFREKNGVHGHPGPGRHIK